MSKSKGGGHHRAKRKGSDDKHKVPKNKQALSKNELERVLEVFKMYETGLRERAIYPRDLATAMHKLGLNPTETEIQDLINEIEYNGLIYYPDFCKVIMRKLREDDDENFHQELFRNLVGPKYYQLGQKASLYNVNAEVLTKEQFKLIMLNLPEYVDEADIDGMFGAADKDNNGYISYREFKKMCEVPKQEAIPDDPNDEDDMVTKPVHKKDTKTVAKNSGRKVETVVSK